MKRILIILMLVSSFVIHMNAQNTWLNISYGWQEDDTRLFQLPLKFAYPLSQFEENDSDRGSYIYSIGFRQKTSLYKNKIVKIHFLYGLDLSKEIQTYSKYFSAVYFTQSDILLGIRDKIFRRYYISTINIPLEFTIKFPFNSIGVYLGLISNMSYSFEKKIVGSGLSQDNNNLFQIRKIGFDNASINPKIGIIYKRFDLGIYWRWIQFSAFDTALYHFSTYVGDNSKEKLKFSKIKYEWYNPFKIGFSLRYRL